MWPTTAEKSVCLVFTRSWQDALLPSAAIVALAKPVPYSESSWTTQTLLALRFSVANFAAAGPCWLSLPSARKKVFHPFLARFGLVADGEMVTRLFSLKIAPAALDSPEKGRPITP